jgi:formylglycine-generating enzyme required for sulfatase activity
VPGTDVYFCIHETRHQDYAAYASDPAVASTVDTSWARMENAGIACGADDNHPVVGVSYEDAVAFCDWLSKKENRFFRLPTDHEWSAAVGIADREDWASVVTPEKRNRDVPDVYPWGGTVPPSSDPPVGNYADITAKEAFPKMRIIEGYMDGFATTAPVMSFQPNPLGLFDLGGNASEWVENWYGNTATQRALRGGAWNYYRQSDILSSLRAGHKPTDRVNNLGFRCVLAPKGPSTEPHAPMIATIAPVKPTPTPLPAKPKPAPPAPPAPAGDPRLAQLATGFMSRYETDAQAPYAAALNTLNQSYVGSNGIGRALAAAQAKADLQEALALTQEKEAVERGAGVPAEDAADTPPSLLLLRATYRLALARLEDIRMRSAAPLYDLYIAALDNYTIELTKASKLEDAMKVRTLRDKIADEKTKGGPPVVAGALSATGAANAAPLEAPFTNSIGMKFVPVPGTTILMCVHETRKKDYGAYATANPGVSSAWKNTQYENVPVSPTDDYPVVQVTPEDAEGFCAWLSTKEGRTYRLPTDREWSFAIGIGNRESEDVDPAKLNGAIKDEYPWGKQWPPPQGAGNLSDAKCAEKFPTKAVIEGYKDGFATTSPVMSFEPNALGIYDLTGNVWEWSQSFMGGSKRMRVVRGGEPSSAG